MATPNKFLEQPARGSLVGVWDTPVNGNMDIVDASLGATATIILTNAPVVLSSAQYRCAFITFTGALSGNCAITFPSVGSYYTVQNLTSNTSTFRVTALTTTAASLQIGLPWGEPVDIMTDSAGNVKFRGLGHVGSYWDYAGSSVPSWVSDCSVPPYLNCDGTAFSSTVYPVLATILGGTTLPNSLGKFRATLNQGAGLITAGSSTGGVDGDTRGATGGSQTTTLSSANIPPVSITDPGHTHTLSRTEQASQGGTNFSFTAFFSAADSTSAISPSFTGITAGESSPINFSNLPPTYIGGLTLIRAA